MLRPRHCVWEATLRCNLACIHCGSRAGAPRGGELGAEESLRLIDDLAELGCERVVLSGGEPLLRSDLADLVRHIARRGMQPCLISNGLILPDMMGLVERLPLHSVAVSVDGLEAAHNHLRRSRESFGRAVQSLRLLSGLFVDVYALTQVNRLNFGDLGALHALLAGLGIDGWQLQLTSGMGRAEELPDIRLDRKQLESLLEFIAEGEAGPLRIHAGDDIGYYRRGRFRFTGCRGGLSVVGIEADGGVKPCLSMQKEAASSDCNIRRRSLRSIWGDPDFAAGNRRGRELAGACAACAHQAACRGGCVGTATAFDSPKEYPFCVKEADS